MTSKNQTWTYDNAVITHVHDGDTVTANILVAPGWYWTPVIRVAGIDAPEIEGSQKPQGEKAEAWLKGLVLNEPVKLVVTGTGDFGRTLAHIIKGGVDLDLEEVKKGLAETWSQHEKEQRDGTEDAI